MCICGHDAGYHDPCSICECPAYRPKGKSKIVKYPRRPTK
jgi:hypothetical protein